METMAGLNKKYSALVIGATGLTGSHLLELLLEEESFDEVVTLSRKRIAHNHPKHKNYVVDLFNPSTYVDLIGQTHLFICTGTTQAKTPNPREYYRIEHDLPLSVAQTALESGTHKVVAVSAMGASPDSKFRYNRGKGEMEWDIESLGFQESYFVQPALIGGVRKEHRPFEASWKKFQKWIDPIMVGFLKKYRTIHPVTIAQAMIYISIHGHSISRIESDDLKKIAIKYKERNARN